MKIFVIGNIASGKTTLCNRIMGVYSNYSYMAIDDYRRRYGNGTLSGEEASVSKFIEAIFNCRDCIVEFSGLGAIAESIRKELLNRKEKAVLFICSRTDDECMASSKKRDYSLIPYPMEYSSIETPEETIRRNSNLYGIDLIKEVWKGSVRYIKKIEMKPCFDVKQLCIDHHDIVDRISSWSNGIDEISDVVLFGSASSWSLEPESDLDLICITHLSEQDFLAKLLEVIGDKDESLYMDGKVVVYDRNKKIEFLIANSFSEVAVYYAESYPACHMGSILKGTSETLHKLSEARSGSYITKTSIESFLNEMIYYARSLNYLADKFDHYRYYFHLNIVLYRAIQIESFIAGDFEHMYLPRDRVNGLEDFPWSIFFVDNFKIRSSQVEDVMQYVDSVKKRLSETPYFHGSEYPGVEI